MTRPFLAEQVLLPVDKRISAVCEKAGLSYSRYVDDVTISGAFDLERSGIGATVSNILDKHGFKVNPEKRLFGRLSEEIPITKLIPRNGRPDVQRAYLEELVRQLDDADRLAAGLEFKGPYFTRGQLAGKVQFVSWINPSRRKILVSKYKSIQWDKVEREAFKRRFVVAKKTLVRAERLDSKRTQAGGSATAT